MKYSFDYQYLPKGRSRPSDDGSVIDGTAEKGDFAFIPNVGDYVNIVQITEPPDTAVFRGRVKTRLFTYFGDHCHINIVVEEVDDQVWPSLIKE